MENTFDFNHEKEILEIANHNIKDVLDKYNEDTNISLEQRKYFLLYYGFKKIDTIKDMEIDEMMKLENINIIKNDIVKYSKDIGIFRLDDNGKVDFDSIRDTISTYMDNSGLKTIINNLSIDIREAYKSAFGDEIAHVYTALPSHGLEGLSIGNKRENQYWNDTIQGVFAVGNMNEVCKYIARASSGGGMRVKKDGIHYDSSPFKNVNSNALKEPVSVYLSNVDDFKPQIDYREDGFIFGDEWVSDYSVSCIEQVAYFLPMEFLDNNKIVVDSKDRDVKVK